MSRAHREHSVEEMLAKKAASQRKYQKTAKGRETRVRYDALHSKLPVKTFIAWDGEGVSDMGGNHRYVLLANSLGDFFCDDNGLSTLDCFRLLTEAGKIYLHAVHVGFSLGYDINMMLKDIPYAGLKRLHDTGRLYFENYALDYRPRKYLEIRRYAPHRFIRSQETYEARIMLWDVFPFFQSSFLKALKSFFNGEELSELSYDVIVQGKAHRADFQLADIETNMLPYCLLECKALVKLMDRLYNTYCLGAGIVLKRFDGCGAIAESLLTRYKVKSFYGYTNAIGDLSPLSKDRARQFNIVHTGNRGYIPDELQRASQHAYGGGRIEAMKYGHTNERVEYEDINSAYPTEQEQLPSLRDGTWVHYEGFPQRIHPYTLYHIQWEYTGNAPFYPFFYRSWPYKITFPSIGENWVWWKEVEAAEKWANSFDGSFAVLDYWRFHPDKDVFPYAFIADLYERRRELKKQGNGMEKVYKLGYNSFYGKTVQHLGYEDHARKEQYDWRPPFFQLQYGGMITSGTRARLFDACMQYPEDVIAIATDGFWSTRRHILLEGDGLGEWEHETLKNFTLAQSGVYWYDTLDGTSVAHYRGFDEGTVSREKVIDAWASGKREITVSSTRFITLGLGLQLNDISKWRTWDKAPRTLSLYPRPNGKRRDIVGLARHPECSLVPTIPNSTLVQWNSKYLCISEPFPLPWEEERQQLNDLLEGQQSLHLQEWEMEE
jgi:hypothetical protein